MKSAVIFDIDGTIADNSHRLHFIKTKPKNWKAYSQGILNDVPISGVVDILHNLSEDYWILLSTGRSEKERVDTEFWLAQYGIEYGVDYSELYMRKDNDYREDTLVKLENLDKMKRDGYNPLMVFEDRPRLIRMYKEQGLQTFDVGNGEEF